MSKSRNYCFTLHDYSEEEYLSLLEHESARYVIIGKETCPTTKKLHLQGFIVFFNAKTLAALKKINPRAHWESCKGSPAQNKAYCSKEGVFEERGDLPADPKEKGERERTRWADVIALSRAGDWDALAEKYPDVYATRLKTCEYIHKRRKMELGTLTELKHLWIVGKTGCGKSRYAREQYPEAYIKDPNTRWWCDYDGQEAVIIDDFDKFQVKQGGDMKRWLDRYPFQAEVKGGMELIRPKIVIVTSQYHPNEIWDDEKTVDAIMRRVTLLDADNVFNRHLFAGDRALKRTRHVAEMDVCDQETVPFPPASPDRFTSHPDRLLDDFMVERGFVRKN